MTYENRHAGLLAALAAAGVSGVAVFVNGIAVRRFDDATVYTTAKNLVAGAVLAVIYVIATRHTPERPAARSSSPSSRWGLAAIAVIGGSVPFVLFFEGLSRASSTNAAFIHKTLVVWVAVGATAFLGERITMAHAFAIGFLLLGHLALSNGLGGSGVGGAEALVLAATLLWACEVVLVKHLLRDVRAETAAVARMVGGGALLLSWVAVTGGLGELASLSASQWGWLMVTGTTLAVFVSVWYRAIANAPAVDVSAVLVLGAVITGALDSGLRGTPLPAGWYGYVLIGIGVSIVAAQMVVRPPSARLRT